MRSTPPPEAGARTVPDKLYFRIGEVAKLVGVKPYVLRYWESEFSILRPEKSSARHRLYRRKNVEMLLEIRRLLHVERYTIEGAKRRLRETGRLGPARATPAGAALPAGERPTDGGGLLARVREELLEVCRILEREPTTTRVPGDPRK